MIYKMCDRTDGVAGHVCVARSKDRVSFHDLDLIVGLE